MSIKRQQVPKQNSVQKQNETVDIAVGSACENIVRKIECLAKNSATGINNANSVLFTANGMHCAKCSCMHG